ncbi:hypothetical protein [Microbulbifer sp. VAAF005]|uniref:BP74-related protein n=1 Tax=Microbulbifer sp. VAAF005 TaxID=3034230 RepID=UPI0024AE3822|nr:hypothetical protein [Microbulbifer sp. VAAF005]WHI47633.1 hypothetical protein P0078_04375 [Microbulbifer sp. VAAF005]
MMKTIVLSLFLAVLSVSVAASEVVSFSASSRIKVAYFEVSFNSDPEETFVLQLTDPDKIKEARRILLNGEEAFYHFIGYVVPGETFYNPGWSFHVDTDSIDFAEISIEVCDSSAQYVEDNWEEVGGAFLPGNIWCPWSSTLVRELHLYSLGL